MRREVLICLLLAGITLGLYWPLGHLGFFDCDDPEYILTNPQVREGLSPDNAWWALTRYHAGNWHPVTWLSLMLDCQFFGPDPGVLHLENVLIHTANALLVFLVLRKMTRTVWRSALVAALFAWHPAHLQSVAWIAERKDVLSGFFMLLTLWAYTRYVQKAESRKQKAENGGRFPSSILHPLSSPAYVLSLACCALGLMSKPMLVTVPFVLLLLDYWPLGRFPVSAFPLSRLPLFRQLLLEKVPFAGLSLATVLATFWAQGEAISKIGSDKLPLLERLGNAPVFVVCYLGKLFWPAHLAIFYAYWRVPVWEQVGCGALVALATVFCLWRLRFNPQPATRNPQPFLLTGWLWFLIMLLPVIGLVQVGGQSIADRYTYLPSIGLFIAVVWGLAELASRPAPEPRSADVPPAGSGTVPAPVSRTGGETPPEPAAGTAALRSADKLVGGFRGLCSPQSSTVWRGAVAALAVACLVACLVDTRRQMKHWRNNVTLYQQAVEAAPKNNSTSYCGLANSQWLAGDLDGAARSFQAALQATTDYPWQKRDELCHHVLGIVRLSQNQPVAAEAEFEATLRAKTTPAVRAYSHKYLGDALAGEGKTGEAEAEYALAEKLLPDNSGLRQQLATSRTLAGLRETSRTGPTPEIYAQMAGIEASGQLDRNALEDYLAALKLKPEAPEIMNNLAWLLATSHDRQVRDGNRAVQYARRACELTQYGTPAFLGTLAAAYAEAGKFDEAIATAQTACDRAAKEGDASRRQQNQELLQRYRAHQTARAE